MKLSFRLERLYKFEYWPFWIFYLPFTLQWLYYSLRSLNFIYFTRANHKTPFGGFFQYSKEGLSSSIDNYYLPKTKLYDDKNELDLDLDNILFKNTFICKPDKGERGKGVEIYYSINNLKTDTLTYPCIVQEYIELPIELGILFYKYPSGIKGISSIVKKEFLSVTGDGKSTLEDLIAKEVRASTRVEYLHNKFRDKWNSIIPLNQNIVLEEIGNHNRGTKFLNANDINSNKLVSVIDTITQDIPGFHYGRLDLKCESIDKLHEGLNIKVIEVNGVASEAAHIYDPKTTLMQAYKAVFKNLEIVFKISRELNKQGIKTPNSLKEFVNTWIKNYY